MVKVLLTEQFVNDKIAHLSEIAIYQTSENDSYEYESKWNSYRSLPGIKFKVKIREFEEYLIFKHLDENQLYPHFSIYRHSKNNDIFFMNCHYSYYDNEALNPEDKIKRFYFDLSMPSTFLDVFNSIQKYCPRDAKIFGEHFLEDKNLLQEYENTYVSDNCYAAVREANGCQYMISTIKCVVKKKSDKLVFQFLTNQEDADHIQYLFHVVDSCFKITNNTLNCKKAGHGVLKYPGINYGMELPLAVKPKERMNHNLKVGDNIYLTYIYIYEGGQRKNLLRYCAPIPTSEQAKASNIITLPVTNNVVA